MDEQGYRKLVLWQRAMDLVEEIYRLTEQLAAEERFGLISQLQRAAVSIPSNIAEGWARSHRREYMHHLSYARGSLAEVETQLIVCVRVNRLTREETLPAWALAQEVGKLLTRFMQTLTARPSPSRP